MWSYTRKQKRPMSEINIVPYVDVMLVLLVIFMVTTPLMTQGVKVDLPRTSAEIISPDQELPVIISVDVQGGMFIDGEKEALDPNALVMRVAAELKLHPNKAVLVRGDRNVNYEKVVYAMALLQKAGVSKVGLMTAGTE